ncbi:MAG TPA: thioredoxin domain-containing protein, partial [Gemmatimonas sp.]|nr:thioredoxin domain-containing protein [Gemmatimonas sp.]
ESSPYLKQHASNPVDWYPWGPEAFARARDEDKPILLSVGYAACHWCHVMAHESFEDDETAALMNERFVNVKVDREERPDVDGIYMTAVQAMIGHGGWPMTVVLTPEGHPYWGGTYFPRDEQPGMPSFKRVLTTIADAWTHKRDAVERTTAAMRELYENSARISGPTGELSTELLGEAFSVLRSRYDAVNGGFEGAPKFPQAMALDFCLRWHAASGDAAALEIARHSFLAMARGGIYDQLRGGFARYSVDAEWLVPHFEKMLYDNALLARLGVALWLVTRDDEIRRVVEDTLAWLAAEMTSPEGGFYSSLDADSEGHEGKFYVWDASELDTLLGNDASVAKAYWGVHAGGNFEGKSILHVPADIERVATQLGTTVDDVRAAIARAVPLLLAARAARVRPGLDDKILSAWNGLMTRALAEAARAFGDPRWRDMAVRNAEFLRDRMVREGRVMRVFSVGGSKGPGFLDDHAATALAFMSVHELTLEPRWLVEARAITTVMEQRFRDPRTGAWYDTADDAEPLITRPRDLFDNATPSGPSLALEAMIRTSELDGDAKRRSDALMQLAALAQPMREWPNGFGHALGATDLALAGAVAVAIVGDPTSPATRALTDVVNGRYLPRLVLVSAPPDEAPVPLLRNRPSIAGAPTAYVCRGFACDLPVTDPSALREQLDRI